jgi:hypothetical protein
MHQFESKTLQMDSEFNAISQQIINKIDFNSPKIIGIIPLNQHADLIQIKFV